MGDVNHPIDCEVRITSNCDSKCPSKGNVTTIVDEPEIENKAERNGTTNEVDRNEEHIKPTKKEACETTNVPNATTTGRKNGKLDDKGKSRYLGIMLAFLAAFMYSASSYTIKILKFHAINLGVWRFIVLILLTLPFLIHGQFCRKRKEKSQTRQADNESIKKNDSTTKADGIMQQIWPPNETTLFLLLQAILGSNSIVLVFFGLTYLNLGDSAVICTSAPVFVTIVAWVVLKERCGFIPIILPMVALVGVGIICKPPIITGGIPLNQDTVKGVFFSFSSMILLTFSYVLIRYLRKVHHALIQLSFALWGLLQSGIMGWLLGVIKLPTVAEAGLIVLNAIMAFTAQTCITLALKYEQAGVVALVRMTEVIFCYFWQAFLLNVQPDLFSVIGAVVTLSCVLVAALRKTIMSLEDNNKYKKLLGFLLY